MNKIAYIVICRIKNKEKVDEWLSWLRDGHIAEVLAGGASDAKITRLDDDESKDICFEIFYHFASREAFDDYIAHHAPRLRAEGAERFSEEDGFFYSRKIGEVIYES
jgi:hypothetical protein